MGYLKKFLRFVARLRATFGVFGGISERTFDLGARPAEGFGGTNDALSKAKAVTLVSVVLQRLTPLPNNPPKTTRCPR